MTDNFSFTRKVADSGFNPPQNNVQTTQKKVAVDQRRETHCFDMGFDGNGFKKNDLKQEKNGKKEPKKGPLEADNDKGTFWTACSYCYYKYEYEKKYEGCCLLCRNCRKAFHAVAVAAPLDGLLVKEKEGKRYSRYGFSQSSYSGNSSLGDKKEVSGGDNGNKHDFVEISDDSDDDKKEMKVRNETGKMKVKGLNNGEGRVLMKKVKSVPMNTKKMAGRGVKGKKVEKVGAVGMKVVFGNGVAAGGRRLGSGSGSGSHQNGFRNEDELEFFEGDDDIFVGLRDIC